MLALVVLVLIEVEAQACSLWYDELVIFSVELRVLTAQARARFLLCREGPYVLSKSQSW